MFLIKNHYIYIFRKTFYCNIHRTKLELAHGQIVLQKIKRLGL
jgi:hypothetical protein